MHDGIFELHLWSCVRPNSLFFADEAVFLSHGAALDSVRILLCKFGLPQTKKHADKLT